MKPHILVVLFSSILLTKGEEILVKLKKGTLQGVKQELEDGKPFYAFKGIPYAQPPVKDLRFADPVEIHSYGPGVFAATDDGFLCPQYSIGNSQVIGDENCLVLNVFTPKLDAGKRAVVVYIHGGAYITGGGSSQVFNPALLIEQDLVVVTFNYRLGPLGFLTTEDGTVTGNQAIKDQIMVLKWVQENIDKFGGNPNKVTLMGDSSGAAAISIHFLSPLSKGLFHGGILLSGNILCDQYLQNKPLEATKKLSYKFVDCNTETGADFIRCLRKLTNQEIIKASQNMYTFWGFPRWFAPTVDGIVLPDHPEKLLQAGKFNKVPLIIGQTRDEGGFFYRLIINTFNNGAYVDNFLKDKLPKILPVISNFNSKLYPLSRQVKKKYFTNVDLTEEDEFRPPFIDFLTDIMYTRCVNSFGKLVSAQNVLVYKYSFEYRGQYSIVNLQGEQVDMGVAHGDDIQYIFNDLWGEELEMSSSDKKFSRNIYSRMLADFAKTSIPVPALTEHVQVAWPPLPASGGQVPTFKINSRPAVEIDYNVERIRFWNETVPELYAETTTNKTSKKEEL